MGLIRTIKAKYLKYLKEADPDKFFYGKLLERKESELIIPLLSIDTNSEASSGIRYTSEMQRMNYYLPRGISTLEQKIISDYLDLTFEDKTSEMDILGRENNSDYFNHTPSCFNSLFLLPLKSELFDEYLDLIAKPKLIKIQKASLPNFNSEPYVQKIKELCSQNRQEKIKLALYYLSLWSLPDQNCVKGIYALETREREYLTFTKTTYILEAKCTLTNPENREIKRRVIVSAIQKY